MTFEEAKKAAVGNVVIFVRDQTIYLADGGAIRFDLDGDCCSRSYYTPDGEAAFAELLGAKILDIESREDAAREDLMIQKHGVDEVDAWAFLVFTTDKGHVTMDWRNASNGYYGGSVDPVAVRGLCAPLHDAALERRHEWVSENFERLQKATEPAPPPKAAANPDPPVVMGGVQFATLSGALKAAYGAELVTMLPDTSVLRRRR